MPNSLKARIKKLAYQNIISDKDRDRIIKALEQEPNQNMVHVETLEQVMWERDIAISQLKELGYGLGEKIKTEQEPKTDKALPWESGKIIVPLPKPKTVLYSGDGYADGYMVYDMAECPNCGYEYEDGDKDWGENFCPHCGQPLKWESEEI